MLCLGSGPSAEEQRCILSGQAEKEEFTREAWEQSARKPPQVWVRGGSGGGAHAPRIGDSLSQGGDKRLMPVVTDSLECVLVPPGITFSLFEGCIWRQKVTQVE